MHYIFIQAAEWCLWPPIQTPSSSSLTRPQSRTAACVWPLTPNRNAKQDTSPLETPACWSSPVLDLRMSSTWRSTEKLVWGSKEEKTFSFSFTFYQYAKYSLKKMLFSIIYRLHRVLLLGWHCSARVLPLPRLQSDLHLGPESCFHSGLPVGLPGNWNATDSKRGDLSEWTHVFPCFVSAHGTSHRRHLL